MLNQTAIDALCSVSYVEDYIDCAENLPDDLQRYISQMREYDVKYQDFGKDQENAEPPKPDPLPERSSKRARRQRSDNLREDILHDKQEEKTSSAKKSKKKKRKSKAEKEREDSPVDQPIDPDEPTYCLCEQVSFGEMICCDNEQCSIEWFHFSCVGLSTKPKGKWYCPNCRGDRPTIMKSKM
uniref:Inhibitor of growth protein n=1 Tax=Strigamia maritima TaxID=126957 RepID=T1IRH2_STRMM